MSGNLPDKIHFVTEGAPFASTPMICKLHPFRHMNLLALIISIIALILALSKWIYDFQKGNVVSKSRVGLRSESQVKIQLLANQTNCFITRGGFTLFLLSLRIYNESDQRPVTIEECTLSIKNGRRWQEIEPYETPQAAIFPGLMRHNMPITIEPSETQDFYEVFQLYELISGTRIRIKLRCLEKNGEIFEGEDELYHRTDERPVFDILFRTLGV